MANSKNLKPPWPKGTSGNPKGKQKHPKNFVELRAAIQAFLSEPSTKNRSRLDKVLSDMARNKGERKALLEFAYGKVPVKLEGPGENGEHIIVWKDETKHGD